MENDAGRKHSRERLNRFVHALRDEIWNGQRRAGEFLPSEKTFAEQYALSNQTVRKGLELLVAEGLIEKLPRVGSKVIGPPQAAAGSASIKLGYHTSITGEADMNGLLAEFRRQHPELRVQPVPLSNYDYGHIRQYLNGGILDVVMMNYTDFRSFTEAGDVELLKPLERNPDMYSILSDAFTVDGQPRVQPFIFSPLVLLYNQEHFREMQLPEPDSSWQWSDLLEHAARLAVPNERLGFHCELYSPNRWPLLPLQTGAKAERTPDGGLRLSGSSIMEAIRFCRGLLRDFPLMSEGIATGESENLFAKGKASMIMTSYFYMNYLMGKDVPFEVATVPHFGTPTTLLLNIGLAVNALSPSANEAIKLVEFMGSRSTQLMIRKMTYSLPALKSAAEWRGEETIYRPSRFQLYRETIPSFRYFTDLGIGAGELALLNQEVKLYWAGLESEEELIARLEGQLKA